MVITVNPLPTVSPITGPTTVCVNATINLSSSPAGGTWSSSNPSVATIGSTGIVTGISGGNSTISYTVTNGNGCTRSVTYAVSVFPNPIIASAGSSTICSGTSTTLSATGGSTYTWSPATGLSSTTGSSVIASPTTTTTYTVTGTDVNGCNNSATVTVTVLPSPAGGTLSPNMTTVCTGSNSGTLTLSGYTGNIVRWESSTNGGGTWTTITNGSTTYSYSNLTQTTLYRVLLSDGTCSSYSTGAVVTVIPQQPVTAIANPTTICPGESSVLTGSGGLPITTSGIAGGHFNNANPAGWCVDGQCTGSFLPANGDNHGSGPWRETNDHTFVGDIFMMILI